MSAALSPLTDTVLFYSLDLLKVIAWPLTLSFTLCYCVRLLSSLWACHLAISRNK